jgi:hypothetical protein
VGLEVVGAVVEGVVGAGVAFEFGVVVEVDCVLVDSSVGPFPVVAFGFVVEFEFVVVVLVVVVLVVVLWVAFDFGVIILETVGRLVVELWVFGQLAF